MRACAHCKNVFGNEVGGVGSGMGGAGWCCSDSCRGAYLDNRRSLKSLASSSEPVTPESIRMNRAVFGLVGAIIWGIVTLVITGKFLWSWLATAIAVLVFVALGALAFIKTNISFRLGLAAFWLIICLLLTMSFHSVLISTLLFFGGCFVINSKMLED
jgi:hypothetical protein